MYTEGMFGTRVWVGMCGANLLPHVWAHMGMHKGFGSGLGGSWQIYLFF